MRVYTPAGDLAIRQFSFPDSQPHIEVQTHDIDFTSATVETTIKSPVELFEVALVVDVLRNLGYRDLRLDCRYLMGARMDRAITPSEPFTLQVVSRQINSLGFSQVRLLDVHSEVAERLIRNSTNLLPQHAIDATLSACNPDYVVAPDAGARNRVESTVRGVPYFHCTKHRNPRDGKLTEFAVNMNLVDPGAKILIVDDICDGGATFTGLSKKLREAGASRVDLFITHGIFSRGLPLDGIDRVFTTDSYQSGLDYVRNSHHQPFESRFSGPLDSAATVIPISMKEIR